MRTISIIWEMSTSVLPSSMASISRLKPAGSESPSVPTFMPFTPRSDRIAFAASKKSA